jgi:hypothetical protein
MRPYRTTATFARFTNRIMHRAGNAATGVLLSFVSGCAGLYHG